jgi:hypothetical protein
MSHPAWRRPFPLDALLHITRETAADLGRRCGVNTRSLARWRAAGLTATVADRLAVRSGHHPAEVWPNWWEEA